MLLAAAALGAGVFAVDTATPLDVAVAVLYVVVILIAASVLHRRGIVLVAATCLGLTLFSFLVSHGFSFGPALARCIMSLSAVAITTFLALKNHVSITALKDQADLIDLSHDAIFVRDLDNTITFWSRGAEQLYGWPRDAVIGRKSHALLQTVFPGTFEAIEQELLAEGRWEGTLVHTTQDGARVTVASRWSLRRDARNRPVSVLETNTDISERQRAQEALQQAQADLAHVTRVTTLGELAASIAHEVNQPLAAVVTNGEAGLRWLARDEPDLGEARSALNRIVADAKRAGQVIVRIRSLARKAPTQMVAVHLGEAIDDVIPLVQRELMRHRVRLTLDLDEGLPPVVADRVQLQQVMINLVVNAIQAMETVVGRPREIAIRAGRDADGRVLVAVRDSGVGLDTATAGRLFDPFYTTKSGGMGMGLSICRSIMEAHGGRIWATPNSGPGSTFQFSLPASVA
jgi:two-component system sensor kinase FixL